MPKNKTSSEKTVSDGAIGHTLILGPTSTGKTAHMSDLYEALRITDAERARIVLSNANTRLILRKRTS